MLSPAELRKMHISVSKRRILKTGGTVTITRDNVSKINILSDCVFTKLENQWIKTTEEERRALQGELIIAPAQLVGNFSEVILDSGLCVCHLWPNPKGLVKVIPFWDDSGIWDDTGIWDEEYYYE